MIYRAVLRAVQALLYTYRIMNIAYAIYLSRANVRVCLLSLLCSLTISKKDLF
jgi:hypothetical protein